MNDVGVEPRPLAATGLAPFSLRDVPAFIERQFPVGRLSAEAYKERRANAGQALTALGSYWKGRKPLLPARAVVLGCLLPATEDAAADLDIFLRLMAMDDAAFGRRFNGSASAFARLFPGYAALVTEERPGARVRWRDDLFAGEREQRVAEAFATLPYSQRLRHVRRPEECEEADLLEPIWPAVNAHLGAQAHSLPALVEQLGIARFGQRPRVADTFCGGGSIPFEAARIGCDVNASDLNPVACMLTWGAFNIIGAPPEKRSEIEAAQTRVAAEVDAEVIRLGIEHDADGNRAKAYLYCLETRCPRTGWMVPMAPSWVISKTRNVVAVLVPDHDAKRYVIEVRTGVSAEAMADAERGTVREGRLDASDEPRPKRAWRCKYDPWRLSRRRRASNRNRLRQWEITDFVPRTEDIFHERLYCVQWIRKESLKKGRQDYLLRRCDKGRRPEQ